MKCCYKIKSILSYIDLYGIKPELYYKGDSKQSSLISIGFTIIYIIIYIALLSIKIIRAYERLDVTFYDTYAYKDIPKINLTNEEFYGGFAMGGKIDETLYNVKAQFISKVKNSNDIFEITTTDLETEICQLEKFGSKYRKLFKNKAVNELYCLKVLNLTLEGYLYLDRYSFINLQIYPCINHTKDGRPCKDYEEIRNFFEENQIEFKIQDNSLTPEIYNNPIEPMVKNIPCPVFLNLYQKIYSYIQIVNVETNEDIIGLNIWAKDKIETYTKYLDSFIISAPGTADILNTGGPVCDITIQLASTVLTKRRTYPSLIDQIGEVSGFMEIIYAILKFLSSIRTNNLYQKSLVNNLFSFDFKQNIISI